MIDLKKFLLGFFVAINAITMMLGISLICVGCYMLTKAQAYDSFIEKGLASVPGFAIFLGSALTVIFFFGCCGMMRKSICMTSTFTTIMFILLLLSIGCSAAAFLFSKVVSQKNTDIVMEDSLARYNTTQTFWDKIQPFVECCGVNGSGDYLKTNQTIPQSCCKPAGSNCDTKDSSKVFTDGCYPVIMGELGVAKTIFNLSMGVVFFELMIVIGSCHHVRRFRAEYKSL